MWASACHASPSPGTWSTSSRVPLQNSSSKVAERNKLQMEQRKRAYRLSPLHSVHALASKAKRFCEMGQLDKAFDLLSQMDELGYVPSNGLYWSLLNLCKKKKALTYASQLYSLMGSLLLDPSNYFLAEYLVSTLVSCSALDAALEVFHKLPHKTTFSWTAVINGHVEAGDALEALKLYSLMLKEGFQPDEFTCVSLLKACTSTSNLEVGKSIHDYARQNGYHDNAFIGSTLITMYGKCGSMEDAEEVFAAMPHRGVVVWTSLLTGYVEHGQERKALLLYRQMREECLVLDEHSFVVALQACCLIAEKEKGIVIMKGKVRKVVALEIGGALHADALRKGFDSGLYIGNVLVLMYGKCGDIRAAEGVFCGFTKKNVALWNAMLLAYTEQGLPDRALQLFKYMHEEGQRPEERSYVISLQACSLLSEKEAAVTVGESLVKLKTLNIGEALHTDANKKNYDLNPYVSSALLNMYGKCGDLTTAKRLFNGLSQDSIVLWNAMLSAYVEQGQSDNALQLYHQMRAEGVGVDDITLISALQISGQTGSIDFCRQTYIDLVFGGFDRRPLVMFNLIYAFGKCASMVDAQAVFDSLPVSSLVPYNALISGYAQHGDIETCSYYFQKMQQVGLKPDSETYFSLLAACSYAGQIRQGLRYFDSMIKEHGLTPQIEHYEMMVNLHGYAGDLDKVKEMLSRLPMEPNASLWLSLLKVCAKHGNLQLGKQAFDGAVCLWPKEATAYLLMSRVYVDAGLQDLANHLEIFRQKEGAMKKDEISWCEHQQRLLSFSVGEHRKLNQQHMYTSLLEFIRQMKDEAQVLGSKFLLLNAATTELRPSLCSHSQLLALAFVLVNPPFKNPVQVKKNACICQDCHTLIKLISDIKEVCIIVIDDSLIHLFKSGKCSCHDYFYAHSKGY